MSVGQAQRTVNQIDKEIVVKNTTTDRLNMLFLFNTVNSGGL